MSSDKSHGEPRPVLCGPYRRTCKSNRPTLTMMMSIVHRITGIGLYFGTLLLAWWFISAAAPTAMRGLNGSSDLDRPVDPVRLYLGADPSYARGIRHLIWDSGRGSDQRARMARGRKPDRLHHHHVLLWIIGCWRWEARMSGETHIRLLCPKCVAAARRDPYRALLASAPYGVRQYPAYHRAVIIMITLLGRNQAAVAQISAHQPSASSCCCSSLRSPFTCGSAWRGHRGLCA